jgi:uncharacterized protein YyaL (SSP411 family)
VPDQLAEIRRRLVDARGARVRPGLDDKRITSWNALMISALAETGAVLERRDYLNAARGCAEFLLGSLRDAGGRLLRTWKDGRGRLLAYLEDHAYLLDALLVLYESSFEQRWYDEAVALADAMLERFEDRERGGFFTTGADHAALVVRRKDLDDTPIPSGNSAAAVALLRLFRLSGEARFEAAALSALRLLGAIAVEHPLSFANLLRGLDFQSASVVEVAIVSGNGADAGAEALIRAVRARYRPHIVLAGTQVSSPSPGASAGQVPLLEGRGLLHGSAAAYVCERFACKAPVADVASLDRLLERRS